MFFFAIKVVSSKVKCKRKLVRIWMTKAAMFWWKSWENEKQILKNMPDYNMRNFLIYKLWLHTHSAATWTGNYLFLSHKCKPSIHIYFFFNSRYALFTITFYVFCYIHNMTLDVAFSFGRQSRFCLFPYYLNTGVP